MTTLLVIFLLIVILANIKITVKDGKITEIRFFC